MAKKETSPPKVKQEKPKRVLTAEGWKRLMLKKMGKSKKG